MPELPEVRILLEAPAVRAERAQPGAQEERVVPAAQEVPADKVDKVVLRVQAVLRMQEDLSLTT